MNYPLHEIQEMVRLEPPHMINLINCVGDCEIKDCTNQVTTHLVGPAAFTNEGWTEVLICTQCFNKLDTKEITS